jgi:alpha-tubulin suppressor-like RCC1 family protein
VKRLAPTRRRIGLAVFALALAACGLDVVGSGVGPASRGIDAGPETGAVLPEAGPITDAADAAVADSGDITCDAAACVDEIAADYTHTCAAIHGARPRCWGDNSDGQLGSGVGPDGGQDLDASTTPRLVAVPSPMRGVTVGGAALPGSAYSCSRTASGEVTCWGQDDFGQRGRPDGGAVVLAVPTVVSAIGNALDVQAGGGHACARHGDGGLSCWGYDVFGQLGHTAAGAIDRTPTQVAVRAAVKRIATGDSHTCALLADDAVDCWGYDGAGQLGRAGVPVPAAFPAPATVTGVAGAIDVAAGYGHTCAALKSGSVMCWGYDSNGQLGRGAATAAGYSTSAAAVVLPAVPGATAVCAGYLHSCALLSDGTVMCWGYNDKGQLGNGTVAAGVVTPVQSAMPVAVTGLTGARAITCGGHHTCAIVENSQAVCWGANDKGQLGAGIAPDALPRPTPVKVAF